MALEQIRKFIEKINSDDTYLGRILAIKDPDERMAAIKEEGFDFSREELLQVQKELRLS